MEAEEQNCASKEGHDAARHGFGVWTWGGYRINFVTALQGGWTSMAGELAPERNLHHSCAKQHSYGNDGSHGMTQVESHNDSEPLT